ncbi:Stealth CR1 domain-containing protein [Vibrio sp. SCSIO 43135]|uniref:hypothetical protein n=1 Tax=Vibrio sp. SCSIO 43135 TaxID=2819096 RepID=UPI002074EEAA|nr:hypothetical protein [Vibrio sp. SCSIO 43135]USD41337.1 Stealth CR1 domain-containing protein [Vibrio sp. SCSIO 43135]
MKKTQPIDVVLLWVDSNDPNWRRCLGMHSSQKIDISNSTSRFRCWNSLNYIFRAFDTFIPWVNKVHFVTYGHLPSWLNIDHPKLNVVNHSDIFPKSHLPSFNSNAIEVNLNKIPSLSERFILFNDDTFVLAPLPRERFFNGGKPVDFLEQGIKRKGWLYRLVKRKNLLSTSTINNNIEIINGMSSFSSLDPDIYLSERYSARTRAKNWFFKKLYKEYSWFKLNHVPQPHLKSTIDDLWVSHPAVLNRTSSNRFRSESDTTQYLFRYLNLVRGDFIPSKLEDTLSININSSKDISRLINRLDGINLLSITDTEKLMGEDFEKATLLWRSYLDSILPHKSTFEL